MALLHEKRYTTQDFYNIPEDIRAELINGQIVYMASPSTQHQIISGKLYFSIADYLKSKGGTCSVLAAPFSVQLRKENDTVVEPDISVICDTDKINERGCLGAPDWIIEIVSPSNASHDYITKLRLYFDAGVREYWIVDPQRQKVIFYCLNQTDFEMEVYTFQDSIKTNIFNDLYIDFSKMDLGI